jgi:serine/threonine protein kinase
MGQVYKATNTQTGQKVAVKELSLVADQVPVILNEIAIMRKCKHTCVVEYIGAYRYGEDKLWVCMSEMALAAFIITFGFVWYYIIYSLFCVC